MCPVYIYIQYIATKSCRILLSDLLVTNPVYNYMHSVSTLLGLNATEVCSYTCTILFYNSVATTSKLVY